VRLIKQLLEKVSFHNTDILNVKFDFSDYDIKTENLTNINVNIYSLGTKRNDFVYGFGSIPEIDNNIFIISQKLSNSLKPGIYFIRHIKMIYGSPEEDTHKEISLLPKDDFELKFFYVGENEKDALSTEEINQKINEITFKRREYRNKKHITDNARLLSKPHYFRVQIFAIGCLLKNIQELEGITIYPLSNGLSYVNMNNVVNEHLHKMFSYKLPYNEKIDDDYKRSTPMFVIDYLQVNAIDYSDALKYCYDKNEAIFSILAFDKGQRPRLFSYVVIDQQIGECNYGFNFPGYSGNLISDFSPTSTANQIDKIEPLLRKDHWFKFLFESYSNAINEANIDIKYFRLWAILELMAKKEVSMSNIELIDTEGEVIKYQNGDTAKTNKTLGKIYHLIFTSEYTQSTASSSIPGKEYHIVFEAGEYQKAPKDGEKLTLWQTLNALYAIRNATAHEGDFVVEKMKKGDWKQKLAAKYYLGYFDILLNQLESMVKYLIKSKIDQN
jgi:hypothetical protein